MKIVRGIYRVTELRGNFNFKGLFDGLAHFIYYFISRGTYLRECIIEEVLYKG